MYGLVNVLLTTERKAYHHDILWWQPRVIGLGTEIPEPGQDEGGDVCTFLPVMFFCSVVRNPAYCHTLYMVSCQDSVYCPWSIDDEKPERRRSRWMVKHESLGHSIGSHRPPVQISVDIPVARDKGLWGFLDNVDRIKTTRRTKVSGHFWKSVRVLVLEPCVFNCF